MGFTHGKTKIGKKKYKVFVDLENRETHDIDPYFISDFPSFYDEVYVTENGAALSNQSDDKLLIVADSIVNSVTFNGSLRTFIINKKQNKQALTATVTVYNQDYVINYNETFYPIVPAEKNFLPLGPCLNDLTLNDAPGEPIEFLSGEKLITENTISLNLVLPSIPTGLIETLRDFDKVGLVFTSLDSNTGFHIRNLTPFIGMQIQSNELNQTVITVDQSFPLEFIQVIDY